MLSTTSYYRNGLIGYRTLYTKITKSPNVSDKSDEGGDLAIMPSNNAKFKSISPDPKLLSRLDDLGIGFCAHKRARKAIAIKYGEKEREVLASPPPFNLAPSNVKKIASVISVEDIPPPISLSHSIPEICVVGRSNVGKSTLVNAILGFDDSFVQRCSVSARPGETRSMDFYSIGQRKVFIPAPSDSQANTMSVKEKAPKQKYIKIPEIVLVDLPGYSFSYLSPETAENLQNLTLSFLLARGKSLKRVLLLLDARHGFKYSDKIFFEKMRDAIADIRSRGELGSDFGISWKLQICLTKGDLVERNDLARRVQVVTDSLSEWIPTSSDLDCASLPVMFVSGQQRRGVAELQREIASLVPSIPSSEHLKHKEKPPLLRFSKLGGNRAWDSCSSSVENDRITTFRQNGRKPRTSSRISDKILRPTTWRKERLEKAVKGADSSQG
jgi:GTP-binding protein EngB required for normal cell division